MEEIDIPVFHNKKIKEYILCLSNKYKKNRFYFTNTLMTFLLESLNINLKEFDYLFKQYIDEKHEDHEIIYNLSKIISLYIYKKIVISENKTNYINNIISIFENTKKEFKEFNKGINEISIEAILLSEDYRNTLYLIESLIKYTEDYNVTYWCSIDFRNNFIIKDVLLHDLLSIYYCINDFIEMFWDENSFEIIKFFHRNYDDIYNPVEKDKEEKQIRDNKNILKSDLNVSNFKVENKIQNPEYIINKKVILNDENGKDNEIKENLLNKICDTCKYIKLNCICKINENIDDRNKRKTKKETNQVNEINKVLDKIKKHYKKIYNDEDIYKQLINENKQVIKTFSIIHQKYTKNKINDEFVNEIYKLYDTNKARFIKIYRNI